MATNGFEPIRTERLLLRPVRADDAEPLAQRRSDATVAAYQNWIAPYPLERAEALIAEVVALDGPTNDEWYMLTVADPADLVVFGDMVVHLTDEARTAEIGYTFAIDAWGQGYAVEAAQALVDHLFTSVGVTRAFGMLHPDNPASAQVLERVGMLFEGHTRSSFWVGDENSDDWIYGMTRADWEAWRDRPRRAPDVVRLVEISPDTTRMVRRLSTHKSQERFVAGVTGSFGDALFPEVIDGAPVVPWLRAIEADGDTVGFVMLARTTDAHPEPYLWRLLIDRMHQRRGIGSVALDLVIDQCRDWGDRTLLVSWGPGRGSPEPMYLARGFVPTGNIDDGEIEARLTLD
jgi:RimJ/RimL family protein N-acetyltransferase